MKPLKVVLPLAKWLLRISAAILVFQRFWEPFFEFEIETVGFYMALAAVVFTALLFIGGVFDKNAITIISGMVIFAVSFAYIFINGFTFDKLLDNFILASIGLYFLASGNRS